MRTLEIERTDAAVLRSNQLLHKFVPAGTKPHPQILNDFKKELIQHVLKL